VDTLVFLGLLHTAASVQFAIDWGEGLQSSKGYAARLWPSSALLVLAAAHGVTLASAREDFTAGPRKDSKPPEVLHPVKLVALAGGVRRKSQQRLPKQSLTISGSDTQASALATGVGIVNDFVARFDVAGCVPPRFYRVFTGGWALGGRWIAAGASSFQRMSVADREASPSTVSP
jgi:hypothetical protein